MLADQKWDRNADWFKCGLVWEEAEAGFGFRFWNTADLTLIDTPD